MNNSFNRGEMYYAYFGYGIGSEQKGYRPVLIIQNDIGNKESNTVVVAAISSRTRDKAIIPTHYLLEAEGGLETPSIVLLEQIHTIDKQRLKKYIGKIDSQQQMGINFALAISLGLVDPISRSVQLHICDLCINHFFKNDKYELRKINAELEHGCNCVFCNYHKGHFYKITQKYGNKEQ